MSAEAMYWARDQMTAVREGSYLLLLVLAWMHREGAIREPLYEIGRAAHMSVSTVRRHLDTLAQIGALTYEPGGRGTAVRGSITLHIGQGVTPDTLPVRVPRVRPIIEVRASRLETLRRQNAASRVSGMEPYAPPDPPIRNKHYSNGKGTDTTDNGTPTPREIVFGQLQQLQSGDLTPDDLSPRATAVFNALPTTGDRWTVGDLSDAWSRTEDSHG